MDLLVFPFEMICSEWGVQHQFLRIFIGDDQAHVIQVVMIMVMDVFACWLCNGLFYGLDQAGVIILFVFNLFLELFQ